MTRIGVLGAGAVGCYFGARLAQSGVPVTLVGRRQHVDAIQREGLVIRTAGGTEVVSVAASTDPATLATADVVLVTVKSGDTEDAAVIIRARVPPGALIVSLQNGVDNAWRLRAALPNDIVPGVVYVATEMAGPGIVRHNGAGRLVFGVPLATPDREAAASHRLETLIALFVAAGVPCARSPDVRVDLWTKLAANCAYNALSALTGLRYGALVAHAEARELMALATDELVAVAHADDVALTAARAHAAVRGIAETMADALSSTAQDLAADRRTEIEALNGYVVRRGRERGVATPINLALYSLVKLVEAARPR